MGFTFERTINLVVAACVVAVLLAVALDFLLYSRRGGEKTGRRSFVATASMLAFVAGYYLVIHHKISKIGMYGQTARTLMIIGAVMVVAGAVVNIWGRLLLRDNWANQIKIYKDHELISTGPYALVRHPLYASIILMLIGGSVVHRNWLALLLTLVMFTPAMVYRGRLEEALLEKEVAGYTEYKKRTGMLFPRLRRQ